jgi:hypothetical protein
MKLRNIRDNWCGCGLFKLLFRLHENINIIKYKNKNINEVVVAIYF